MALRNLRQRTFELASVRRDIPRHCCKLELGLDFELGEYLSRHSRGLCLAGRGGTYRATSGHGSPPLCSRMLRSTGMPTGYPRRMHSDELYLTWETLRTQLPNTNIVSRAMTCHCIGAETTTGFFVHLLPVVVLNHDSLRSSRCLGGGTGWKRPK